MFSSDRRNFCQGGLTSFGSWFFNWTKPNPKVLNIYNWSNYLPAKLLNRFKKETGLHVNYDTYDSDDSLLAKLRMGSTGYDIVVPGNQNAQLEIANHLFQKIDLTKLLYWKDQDPLLLAKLAQADPENEYLVNWAWGYVALGINVQQVELALKGWSLPKNTWSLIFEPRYAQRLKSVGISFLSDPFAVFPAVLSYMALDPNSERPEDFQAAFKVLKAVRPYISIFSANSYVSDLASGNMGVILGYSGDINIAAQRASEAGKPYKIRCLVPSTGGIMFMDSMAIPADAPHVDNAYRFINFVMEPKNAAEITNHLFYSSFNKSARPYVLPAIRENSSIFLNEDDKRKLISQTLPSQNARELAGRLYTQIRTGM